MDGVTFGSLHSYTNFNLVLTSKTIGVPAPKTVIIDVEGADGEIDLTDYFGEAKYKNRTLEFEFESIISINQFPALLTNLTNAIHGKRLNITLDSDPNYFYVGRCNVSDWKSEGRIFKITVTCDCEPYKYKKTVTTKTNTVVANDSVTYSNGRKSVVPTITSSAAVNFTFGSATYSIAAAGTYTFPDLVFTMGDNVITYAGAATITVVYEEGDL